MILKVDHLGIAVKDLDAQVALYRDQLGMTFEGIEEVSSQQVKVAFFACGETRIELLQSTATDGPIAKHIEKRGEGMHHIAYAVADISVAMGEAKLRGLTPLSEGPRPGAHHTLVCFLHPKTTGGVLTELVQKAE
jgi:methylmalonyl-CoA/ethylmalonyl-CoA epimerase